MQNAIPVEDLKEQLNRLDRKINGYERDLEANLADEHKASAAQSLLMGAVSLRQRVAAAYEKQLAADERQRTEDQRLAALAKLESGESERIDCLESLAFTTNEFAFELEQSLENSDEPHKRAAELAIDWAYNFREAHGRWPESTDHAATLELGPQVFAGKPQSEFYAIASLALRIARDTRRNGPYSYEMVVATLQGAAQPRYNHVPDARPTPKPTDETGMDFGQRMAARRNGHRALSTSWTPKRN